MKLSSKLATFIGALALASSVFASNEVCPSIDEIKAEGISMAEAIAPSLYLAYQISNYNTDSTWGFFIAPFDGEDEDVAISMANEVLATMTAPGIPEQNTGMVICSYETGDPEIFAAAVKDGTAVTPLKLKQYFRKAH